MELDERNLAYCFNWHLKRRALLGPCMFQICFTYFCMIIISERDK